MSTPALGEFIPETLRGSPGFVRVGKTRAGQWWLLDHRNHAFFSTGVASIRRRQGADPQEFALTAARRLKAWRMNTAGIGSAPEIHAHGFFHAHSLEFRKALPGSAIRLSGANLPDVFDKRWIEACDATAAANCAAPKTAPGLIGYVTDSDLEWRQPAVGSAKAGPTLLQICLSLEPSFAAYHAAWEFALAPHNASLEALSAAWGGEIPNKESIRQMTLSDRPLATPGYLRDNARFSAEFSRLYFSICAAAIRRADPGRLILGCRFSASPGPAVMGGCTPAHVDVLAIADPGADPASRLSRIAETWTGPVYVAGFTWTSAEFLKRDPKALTSVERMLGRGRAALETLVRHPLVVGYSWRRWSDSADDQPPFGPGVVHVDDRKAREHTELLADINSRAIRLRLDSTPGPPGR